MKKHKDAKRPDSEDTSETEAGNESHRSTPGMLEKRAERTTGAGSHGDSRAGAEGIDEPGGPLPNKFPPEENQER